MKNIRKTICHRRSVFLKGGNHLAWNNPRLNTLQKAGQRQNGPGTSNGSARDQNSVTNVNGGIVAGIAEAKHYFNVVKFVFLAEFEGLTESFCFQCGL
jgi:hypothetical protein